MTKLHRTRWFMPLFALGLGCAIFVAMWIGGHPGRGLSSLAIMGGFGLLVLLGGRSETIRGLRGDGRDERFSLIDQRATALAGNVVIGAIIVAWLVEEARGEDGRPFTWLGAIAGVAYIVGVVLGRVRS